MGTGAPTTPTLTQPLIKGSTYANDSRTLNNDSLFFTEINTVCECIFRHFVTISRQIRDDIAPEVSRKTVSRRLNEAGLHACNPREKPLLSEKNIADRFKYGLVMEINEYKVYY